MGALAWSAIGFLAVYLARSAVRRLQLEGGMPSLGAGWVGAVVGGFLADLSLAGDSVMNFQGPTVLGAAIGAVVLIAITYRAGWTTTSRRHPA